MNNVKYLIAFAIVVIACVSVVVSVRAEQYCEGDYLLDPIYVGESLVATLNDTCEYGCDSNNDICNPAPIMQYATIGGVCVGILGVFGLAFKYG